MTYDNFRKLIDKLSNYGTQVITLSGGDPLLHPQLEEFADYAYRKNFARIHLLTTLYGSDKQIEKTIAIILKYDLSMSVSFDGFGEIADQLRGAKNVAEIVKKNMWWFEQENKKRNKPLPTGVNIVISKLNLHQVPDILDFLEEIKWSVDVDIYRWRSSNQIENDILKLEDTPEFRKVLDRVRKSPIVTTPKWLIDGFPDYINQKSPKYCPYLDTPVLGSKFFIEADGVVGVCIGEPVGNLLEQTPQELFNSKEWRQKIEEFKKCQGCWNTCYSPLARLVHPKAWIDIIKGIRISEKW